MANWVLLAPFGLQGGAMMWDEFYFHRRRGLGRWESLGHPLDTLSVLSCYAYLLLIPSQNFSLAIYLGLTGFSCLLVTKDEFVHRQECVASEAWLHSLLFVLHPIVFFVSYLIWVDHQSPSRDGLLWHALQGQTSVVLAFGFFQVVYWNLIRRST